MSKTKKNLFYSAIVAVVILLAFVAVTFMTAPDGNNVVSQTGQGQTTVFTKEVSTSDSGYSVLNVTDNLNEPGTVSSDNLISNNIVSGAQPITDASGLDSALKTGGTYYLVQDISYNASTGNTSAATNGTFSGVLYGNGHTITVNVPASAKYSFQNGDGTYGFLVKYLTGTIRDVNVVINAASGGSLFGLNTSNVGKSTQPDGESAYMARIGGIAGGMSTGLIHNCTVTYNGTLRLQNNGTDLGSANAWGSDNMANVFGGVTAFATGGVISYTNVVYNGSLINVGQQNDNGANRLMINTGGFVGQIGNGKIYLRKISLLGNGSIESEAHTYDNYTWGNSGYATVLTGGLVGWVSAASNSGLDANGVYINLTKSGGAVKSNYISTGGVAAWACSTATDSIDHDYGDKNMSSATNASEMRDSYGIGGMYRGKTVALNNVYMTSAMAQTIKGHHPFAIHEIAGINETKNNWTRWNWTYTLIDTTTLGTEFVFARNTAMDGSYSYNSNTATEANNVRGVYFRLTNQSASRFVYQIKQGSDSSYDIYSIYNKTYNNFGSNGTVYVPAMYTGYASTVNPDIGQSNNKLTSLNDFTSSNPTGNNATSYSVSAEFGSYLYMDFDMSTQYNGVSKVADGYQGSGNNYTYTYSGDTLYVPAFAGYKTNYGSGEKVNFTEQELNDILGGTNNFSLSSSTTITNTSQTTYSLSGWYNWANAGNVGTYQLSYNKQSSDPKFITKDGNHYFCAMMDSYPAKTVSVQPYQVSLNWNSSGFVYDGTGKDVTATFAQLPAGTGLGNNDGTNLGVAVTYSADNENLLLQNKPYHAGEYTATASLTYSNTTENAMTGNYTLANASEKFTVGKVQITVQPENAVSVYGDDHTALLQTVRVNAISGNWVSDDQSKFVFTVKTVDDTVNFTSTKGEYPTTVEASLTEGATAELLGDYDFVVTQGKLTVNERPINGTLTINEGIYNGKNYVATLALDDGVRVSNDSVYNIDYVIGDTQNELVTNAGVYNIRITPDANKYTIGKIIINGREELYSYGATNLTVQPRKVDVTLEFANGYVYDGGNKVTNVALQSQDGDNGVLKGENADLTMTYNDQGEAVMPADYTAVATFNNTNYTAGTINGGTFTVERAELKEIRIDSASATYDGTAKHIGYTLVGVAGEENINDLAGTVTVTYNKATANPVNAGEYAVEISVAEGKAYKATKLDTTFIVNKAQIEFTPVTTTTYTGKNIEPEYGITAPGMDDASSLKAYVTAEHSVILNASNYTVTLKFAGTSNYEAKEQSYQLNVQRADLVLSVDDNQQLTYSGKAQTPAYGISALFDGDTYGDVTLTVTGDKASDNQAVNAGSYTFSVSVAESVNYNAASTTVNFTINKYTLNLLGAKEQYLTVIKEGETPVTEIARYTPSLDLALVDETGVYSNDSLVFTGKVDGSDATSFEIGADNKGIFSVEVTVNGLDSNNYDYSAVTVQVTVLDAKITVTVNGQQTTVATVTFGDALTIEAKGQYGDNAEQDVTSVEWYSAADGYSSPLEAQPTDAGEYMAVFTYSFDSEAVTREVVEMKRSLYLTISPKAVTVTLNGSGMNVVYGDDISFDGATYTTNAGSGLTLTVEYSTTARKFSAAGNYVLDGTVAAVTDGKTENYAFTVVPGTFNIGKRTVYVKADDVEATYGDEVILSGFTVYTDDGANVWSDYASAAQLKVTLSVQDGILTVGQYDISVTSAVNDNVNYNVNAVTEMGKLTVNKRQITVTADSVSVVYGTDQLPAVTGRITGGSLVYGDTLAEITGEWKGSETLGTLDVDSYTLTDYVNLSAKLDSAQQGTNYDITFADDAMLTVTPRQVTVTFNGWQSGETLETGDSVTYNAGAWTPSATVEGVINGDDVTVAFSGDEIRNAGTYSRELTIAGNDAKNYTASTYTANLTVMPYKTVINAGESVYTYTYGDDKTAVNPTITLLADDTDDGKFVQKNYVGTNTGVTGVQVDWDSVWDAGTYTVVISYEGNNYTADPVSVTVTVNKKTIAKVGALSGGDLGSKVYDATNVSITADKVADLGQLTGIENYISVVYRLDDAQVAVVRNAGVYTIDLVMTENRNYEIEGGGESLLNAPATYTITKAAASQLRFSLTYANRLYDGTDMSDYIKSVIAVSGINGEPVTGATLALTVTNDAQEIVSPINSGTYTIAVTATAMNNYEDMTDATQVGTFTVDKVYVAIDAIALADKTVTYDSLEQSLAAEGLNESAVLKKIVYEYTAADYTSATGAVNAGTYEVLMTIYLDKLNSRFSDGVNLETVNDPDLGEVYKHELRARLVIEKAAPTVNIDKNSLATYFDGYNHTIEFTIGGVGNDSSMSSSYNVSMGAGNAVTIDGLGTFEVKYYTDADYKNLLADGDGAATLPITVLDKNGETVPYYMAVNFTSANGNYENAEYKNSGYDMALYIMQSIVTLSFNSLSAPYGQLGSQSAANDYVAANMKYTYTVNDEGSASVNYDPEAMLEISYNLTSFDVATGSYEIAVNAVAARTEFAGSVTAVIRNASAIKLNITPAEVTESMKAAFTDVSDTYGNKTYTAADFAYEIKGVLGENVAYNVTYGGAADFSISDAGEYAVTVSIPEGNYKAWTGSVNLSIAKVGLDVVWTMGGEAPVEGAFTKTYDGQPADIAIQVVGADGVTANCVYVNSEGAEIAAPYTVGTHTAKAVLSDSNYYVNSDCEYMTVVIEAIVLNEDTIKGWISDDSDVYGSVQGIDITGLPAGFGATSIVYTGNGNVYDMTTVRTAPAGVYEATVTVSNGSSSGSATFTYTITRRNVVFTVSASTTEGIRPTANSVSIVADKTLASGDTAKVTAIAFTSAYNDSLAFGVYDMADYVSGVTVEFNKNADCYEYSVVMGELTVIPAKAPTVESVSSNYNTVTITFDKEGTYAYRIGARGNWVQMSSSSDTLIISGLNAQTSYSIYVAYAGFTSVNTVKSVTTSADPAVLSQMINSIMQGGLSLEKQQAYDSILAYYEKVAEEDRPEIQSEYDALVAQFNALKENGGNDPTTGGDPGQVNVAVIVVCAVCLLLIVVSIAGVIVAAVRRKHRDDDMLKYDGSLV